MNNTQNQQTTVRNDAFAPCDPCTPLVAILQKSREHQANTGEHQSLHSGELVECFCRARESNTMLETFEVFVSPNFEGYDMSWQDVFSSISGPFVHTSHVNCCVWCVWILCAWWIAAQSSSTKNDMFYHSLGQRKIQYHCHRHSEWLLVLLHDDACLTETRRLAHNAPFNGTEPISSNIVCHASTRSSLLPSMTGRDARLDLTELDNCEGYLLFLSSSTRCTILLYFPEAHCIIRGVTYMIFTMVGAHGHCRWRCIRLDLRCCA